MPWLWFFWCLNTSFQPSSPEKRGGKSFRVFFLHKAGETDSLGQAIFSNKSFCEMATSISRFEDVLLTWDGVGQNPFFLSGSFPLSLSLPLSFSLSSWTGCDMNNKAGPNWRSTGRKFLKISVVAEKCEHILLCSLLCTVVQKTEKRQELRQTRMTFFLTRPLWNKSVHTETGHSHFLKILFSLLYLVLEHWMRNNCAAFQDSKSAGAISLQSSTLLVFLFPWNRTQCQSYLCLKNKRQDDKQFMLWVLLQCFLIPIPDIPTWFILPSCCECYLSYMWN